MFHSKHISLTTADLVAEGFDQIIVWNDLTKSLCSDSSHVNVRPATGWIGSRCPLCDLVPSALGHGRAQGEGWPGWWCS
jgi:hypothetical protein